MNNKNWITWILLLLIPGLAGWTFVIAQKTLRFQKNADFKAMYQQQTKEFVDLYEKWTQLSPDEKSENPWGQDPYGGPTMQQNILAHQHERLNADLPDLVSGKVCASELAEILYGENWEDAVADYRKQISIQEMIAVASTGLLFAGGLLATAWGFVSMLGAMKKRKLAKTQEKQLQQQKAKGDSPEQEQQDKQAAKPGIMQKNKKPNTKKEEAKAAKEAQNQDRKENISQDNEASQVQPMKSSFISDKLKKEGSVSMGYFDNPRQGKGGQMPITPIPSLQNGGTATLQAGSPEMQAMLNTFMTPKPVTQELNELTEQVSAIREFAAKQQSQMQKLQDGYDWLLIKRFCLRIIRCIDNIEDSIQAVENENQDSSVLNDIRDELIFALESSGVETFEPDLDRDYRGLEKVAEAVKERKKTKSADKSGKIAEIIRPGYHYLINEDEVKIVRCAQVKLYA